MADKFVPNGDRKFAEMARRFAEAIAKQRETYFVSEDDAAQLVRRVGRFEDALNLARGYRTRTPSTILLKDEARREAEEIVRRVANAIRANSQISASDRVIVGIEARPTKLTKRTVPVAPPDLYYLGAPHKGGSNCGQHLLFLKDGFTIAGKSKPNGAVRAEIFVDLVAPGDPVPQFPGQYLGGRPWYLRSFTRNKIKVEFPVPPTPMLVVYWARWADATGNVGRFSKTCVARVEGFTADGASKLLGPMPEVRTLQQDPKYLANIAQFRERLLEAPKPEPRALPEATPAEEPTDLNEAA